MKRIISIIFLQVIFLGARSQNIDTSINLDLLNAPTNPAFNLMGISPNAIDRPTDLNAFRLSLQNASSSFTKLPSDYAVEFAPASIFNIKDQTLSKFNSTAFKDIFWQSFSVSSAFTQGNKEDKATSDSTSFSKLGFGLKFSIIRPKWVDSTQIYIDSIHYYQNDLNKELEKNKALNGPLVKGIENKMREVGASNDPNKVTILTNLTIELRRVRDSITTTIDTNDKTFYGKAMANLRRLAGGLKIIRKGPFLDFAAGIALDFPDNRFDNSLVSKAGAWITGGYENGDNGFAALVIGRYLYQPDKIFADDSGAIKTKNISTLDGGARVVYNGMKGKFSFSSEAIYRSVLNDNVIKPSWRFTINAEYSVGFNQKITFAVGKNFDGTVTKDGNLIAALNYIRGFGSRKKVQ